MTTFCPSLCLYFRNKGSEPHQLQCCDFAGWDSQEQFTFILDQSTIDSLDGQSPLLQPGKTWLLIGGAQQPNNPYRAYTRARGTMLGTIGGYGFCPMPAFPLPEEEEEDAAADEEELQRDEVDGDGEGTDAVYEEMRQAAGQKSATRSLERDLEIAPGQKVSVTVGCRGK